MNQELKEEQTALDIAVVAINAAGHAVTSSYDSVAKMGNLPVLQDTEDANAWDLWAIDYRDVIILNSCGEKIAVYNLTANNLGDDEKYQELKELIIEAASQISATST